MHLTNPLTSMPTQETGLHDNKDPSFSLTTHLLLCVCNVIGLHRGELVSDREMPIVVEGEFVLPGAEKS